MSKSLDREEKKNIERSGITYYFTLIFTSIGIALVLYILYLRVGEISPFIILLSISGGGLPLGIFGAYIDYKISMYRLKIRGLEQ